MATVKVRSLIRPNLRFIVPSHTVEVKATKKTIEAKKDTPGGPKFTDDGTVFEPGPPVVQFVNGEAEVDESTWEAMQRNDTHVGLGVVGPDDTSSDES